MSKPPPNPQPVRGYRYAAFISYRHAPADRDWAVWLHRALETYRVPRRLREARRVGSRIGRVFRDEEELPACGDLSREIDAALRESRFLIVVCSPRTPQSKWVNREVERFRELGRGDRVLALLIEGEPAESFPPALRDVPRTAADARGLTGSDAEPIEPLAADVREAHRAGGRHPAARTARLRILARLLGVGFDDLRQRDRERRARQTRMWAAVFAALAVATAAVYLVTRELEQSARAQALRTAEVRQRVVAAQAARGIGAFYQGLLSNMDLMPRAATVPAGPAAPGNVDPESSPPVAQPAAGRPPSANPGPKRPGQPPPPAMQILTQSVTLGTLLGRQLDDRVDHLFLVVHPPPASGPFSIKDVGSRPTPDGGPRPYLVAERYRGWLREVSGPAVSPAEWFGDRMYTLVALPGLRSPYPAKTRSALVASVPVRAAAGPYLFAAYGDTALDLLLVDADAMAVLATSRPDLDRAAIFPDTRAAEGDKGGGGPEGAGGLGALEPAVLAWRAGVRREARVLDQPFAVGRAQLAPSLLTAEPVPVPGRRWFVVAATPLKEAEQLAGSPVQAGVIWTVLLGLAGVSIAAFRAGRAT